MTLVKYKSKRKFSQTPEPKGKKAINNKEKFKSKDKSTIFVVHFHRASHDHYDLRLEMDGVLKSWAVPKEPPMAKNVKRLAVQVEDHPIEYAKFHGIIPSGNYGAGKVEIWDNGKYELKSRSANKIEFNLKGKKLKGNYILIKTHYGSKPGKSWLWFRIQKDL